MVLKFLLIENFAIFINKCFQQMLIKEGAFQPIEQMRKEKNPKTIKYLRTSPSYNFTFLSHIFTNNVLVRKQLNTDFPWCALKKA